MKILKKIGLFLQLTSLLGCILGAYFLASFFLKHDTSPTEFDFPSSAQLTISIDGKTLSDEAFFSLFIQDKDPEIANELKELREKVKDNENDPTLFVGIDIFNDIKIFTDEVDGKPLIGYIFKLNNTRLWDKNNLRLFNRNSASLRLNSTGLIVSSNTLSKKQLSVYLDAKKFDVKKSLPSPAAIAIGYSTTSTKIGAEIQLEENHIQLSGDVQSKSVEIASKLRHRLTPKDVHISSRLFPAHWNNEIAALCKNYNIQTPPIEAFSLNYSQLEIATTKEGVLPLPKLELILQFNSPYSISSLISSLEKDSLILFNESTKSIKIGTTTYYFKQLDNRSIYFGSTKNPSIQTTAFTSIAEIKGSLNSLTTIEGNDFMVAMAKMSPQFKQLEKVVNSIKTMDFKLIGNHSKPLKFDAKMSFQEDTKSINELMKLILQLQK